MFELHMGNIKHCIQPTQFRELAEKTDGLVELCICPVIELRIHLAIALWIHSYMYFDSVMTKFMISYRREA